MDAAQTLSELPLDFEGVQRTSREFLDFFSRDDVSLHCTVQTCQDEAIRYTYSVYLSSDDVAYCIWMETDSEFNMLSKVYGQTYGSHAMHWIADKLINN